MHPVISEYELRIHDRRRHELFMNTVRQRATSALLTDDSPSHDRQGSLRRAIDALFTLRLGWLGRRRPQVGHPHPARSTG